MINLTFNTQNTVLDTPKLLKYSQLNSYYSNLLLQISENSITNSNFSQDKIIINYPTLLSTEKQILNNKELITNFLNKHQETIFNKLKEIGFDESIINLFLKTYVQCDKKIKKIYEATPEEIEQADGFYTYNDKEQLIPLTKKEIELVKVIHKIYYVEFILKPYIIDLKRLQELENKKSLTSETPKEEKERVKFIPLKTPIEREDKQTSNVPPYLIILIDLLTLQRFLIEKYKQLVQEYNKIEKQNEVVEKDIQRSELKREIIKTETLKREITISEKVSKCKFKKLTEHLLKNLKT